MIVITTPTGQIGRHLVPLLADVPVRLVSRRETGSHSDPDVVGTAFAGAGTVFWVVPPDMRAADVTRYYLDFTRPACAAIAAHGVRRVVAVSSLGRGWPGPSGQLAAAFAMDDLFESTGVAYRSLGMPFFMENLLHQAGRIRDEGVFSLPNTADRVLLTVATGDIATVAAGLLRDETWTGQQDVPVIGPDNLTPAGMAGVMSEVLGRPVRFEQAPLPAHPGMAGMVTAQNDGIYDKAAAAPRQATGFREWCAANLT
jgi:uncharacterized protein YbjT (DUF2867 family)